MSTSTAGDLVDARWTLGPPLAVAAIVLVVWQAGVRFSGISPVILPAPSDVLQSFPRLAGELLMQARATSFEALLAFVLSCAFGLAIALLLGFSRVVFEAFYPNLVVFQILPKIALAPLFTFWLGIGMGARLSFAVFISVFPVMLATMTGLARADAGALRLARAVGASRWQVFRAVQIPYALPYFFSGAKVAATLSIIGVVIGEFISANEGLGFYILHARSFGQTINIFAAIVVLCIIGLLLYAVPAQAERWAKRWWRG
jgi:NitT/TauT family transport system permease protein